MNVKLLWNLAATDSSNDSLFIILLVVAVLVGAGAVLWSKKRGKRPTDLREDAEKALDEEESEAPSPAAKEPTPPVVATKQQPDVLPLAEGKSIREGLEKTRSQGFVGRLRGLFLKELEEDLEERIEEVLLTSDIGIRTAQKLMTTLKETLGKKDLTDRDLVWAQLRTHVAKLVLAGRNPDDAVETEHPTPFVIAVVGVNGTGKTTTVGKLAARYKAEGKSVMLVAADTFRAAASEQLEIWAKRADVSFHRGEVEQDPASVAFDGIKKGLEERVDIIMVDTAGRLHTKKNLLEELKKIVKVIGKACPGAPHETLLVLDSTTGQNAIQQAEIFHGEVGVDAIVLTKLDGTAKGGVVIGICDMMQIPVKYIGIGEAVEDLRPFHPDDFVDALFGNAD